MPEELLERLNQFTESQGESPALRGGDESDKFATNHRH